MNKRGNILDIPYIMVVLLIFGVFAIFGAFLYDEVADGMIGSNAMSSEATTIINDTNVVSLE